MCRLLCVLVVALAVQACAVSAVEEGELAATEAALERLLPDGGGAAVQATERKATLEATPSVVPHQLMPIIAERAPGCASRTSWADVDSPRSGSASCGAEVSGAN
jgi:hypothetical protein